jgi:hypothetical protein
MHQILVYADDVKLLGGSTLTKKKNAEALLVASKETGLQENAVKTKYMFMSHEQNAGKYHKIKYAINPF